MNTLTTHQIEDLFGRIMNGERISPDLYPILKEKVGLSETLRRYVFSRPYENTYHHFETFMKEALVGAGEFISEDGKKESTDIYINFGKGEPLFLGDVEINRSMFIFNVNVICKGLFFYKVVRTDSDNTIQFIQVKEVADYHFRQLLLGIINSIAKLNGELEARAYANLLNDPIKRCYGNSTKTIILPPDNIFSEEVLVITERANYKLTFTDSIKFKSVENRLQRDGRSHYEGWIVTEEIFNTFKGKADYIVNLTETKIRIRNIYKEFKSMYPHEFFRVRRRISEETENNLWKQIMTAPKESSWCTCHYLASAVDAVRVIDNIHCL